MRGGLNPDSPLPRRVLMTGDAVGGVWQYALELARGFAARGIDSHLALMGPPPPADHLDQAEQQPRLAVHHRELPLDWMAASLADLAPAKRWLRELADEIGPDIMHVNAPILADMAAPAPVVAAAHSCLASWWSAVKAGAPPEQWAWCTGAMRAGLLAADAVIVPTAAHGRAMEDVYGPLPQLRAVHNGRTPRAAAAAKAPLILTAGRLWDEGKNVAVLDAAAAGLDWPVEMAGPLEGPNGARTELRHAVPLGRLDETAMAQRMAAASIFASPALYEPFGLAVLEAAGHGCALVLSDVATFRELWDGCALFVPPRDAAGWTAALEALIADPLRRREIADAARARARRYTAEAMVDGTLGVYGEVLARAAPRQMAGAR